MKLLITLIVLVLSLEGVITLAHGHKDGKKHPECAICVVKGQQQLEDGQRLRTEKPIEFPLYIKLSRIPSLHLKETCQTPSARGPPQ